ncbi:uncharacterized protein LOC143181415 [Calliopsis andreniformis]|uniref:uncharacterized protein LOC143181415 n=1 Tax=Calliopsis andreniformis TaxID=337506 RepID=UPI003FCCBB06
MKMKFFKIVMILILSGSGDARPQNAGEVHDFPNGKEKIVFPEKIEALDNRRSVELYLFSCKSLNVDVADFRESLDPRTWNFFDLCLNDQIESRSSERGEGNISARTFDVIGSRECPDVRSWMLKLGPNFRCDRKWRVVVELSICFEGGLTSNIRLLTARTFEAGSNFRCDRKWRVVVELSICFEGGLTSNIRLLTARTSKQSIFSFWMLEDIIERSRFKADDYTDHSLRRLHVNVNDCEAWRLRIESNIAEFKESMQPLPTMATFEDWKPIEVTSTPQTIPEDSRYTWNSGTNRIPYINYYRDNTNPFLDRNVEVSVHQQKETKSIDTQRSSVDKFQVSSKSLARKNFEGSLKNASLENLGKLGNKTLERPTKQFEVPRNMNQQTSKVINDKNHRDENLTKLRSPIREYLSPQTRNFRISHFRSSRRNSTGPLTDSSDARDKMWRRPAEIGLNNSGSTALALGHNPNVEFSGRKAEFSTGFVKVQTPTSFDHVAAIKKITSMLAREDPKLSSNQNASSQSMIPIQRVPNFSNRVSNSKHSNRTKFHPPKRQSSTTKKGQNKINSNKVAPNKNSASTQNTHLKNWPNGEIQNSDDLQNYEKYTSLGNNSTLEEVKKPVPHKNVLLTHNQRVPVVTPDPQEINHWLKIPAFMANGSHVVQSEASDPVSIVFNPVYQNLEPNKPARPSDVQIPKPGFGYPLARPGYNKLPSWLGNGAFKNKTVFNPHTQVQQNTVVHLINTNLRKPNRTTIGTKVPGRPGASGSLGPTRSPGTTGGSPGSLGSTGSSVISSEASTSKPGPNVHIGFTSYEEKNKVPQEEVQPPLVTYDQSCPTILINSYTRINNTIQSKEGCTDLNIIINSHVFNTNTFKTTPPPNSQLDFGDQTYEDKYVGQGEVQSPEYQSVPIYEPSSPGSTQWVQNDYGPSKVPGGNSQQNDVSSDVSNVEVFQGTQISLSNQDAENDVSSVDDSTPVEAAVSEDEEFLGDNAESVSQEGSAAESGFDSANDSGLNSVAQPAAADVSELGPPSASPSPAALASSPAPASDDDDDDFDLTPFSIMESIASVFTYFTFVNPLHYGFFSLAAAPFTALAAGVLGIVAFLFPWAFPSSLTLRRANDNDFDYWHNVEEIVRQAIDKYSREFWLAVILQDHGNCDLSFFVSSLILQTAGDLMGDTVVSRVDLNLAKSSFKTVLSINNCLQEGIASICAIISLNFLQYPDPLLPKTRIQKITQLSTNLNKKLKHLDHLIVQLNNTQRQLKDYQSIDQSLRTMATQLLNVTNPEKSDKVLDSNVIKKANVSQKPLENGDVSAVKELTVNNGQSANFGRPLNSKFSYFEASHPGQAMAITEEELEKEISSTRLMTVYKNHPTTTGGISTWILLNSPSTTMKTELEKKTKLPSEAETRMTMRPTTLMERVETTERIERVTVPLSTTLSLEDTPSTKNTVLTTRRTPDPKPGPGKVEVLEKESVQNTTVKVSHTTISILESKEASGTTKKAQTLRTTPKPKIATMKTTVLSKPSITKTSRPNQQARPKLPPRRTTVKPETLKNDSSTAKIEKVTFRPVQMITVSKSKPENTEKPMFVTKIKASILMDTQKTTTQAPVLFTEPPLKTTLASEPTEAPVKAKPTKVNNVLKVQLKKPLDETTKIEIEPIKISAPVLKIEKVEEAVEEKTKDTENLGESKVDLKFDFNPELTKVTVDTETSSTSTTPSTSTTKRPRHSSKRKKNKNRRRKPSTSTTTVSPLTSSSTDLEILTESITENDIQESKIEPETKVAVNTTKTKKKTPQKPISTQIYNFLSREVMPSFGVMSLVGLGLGLASYFLYPFGGTIARRNYEVEPKYKYNLEEYGGNYGQREEEVLSKVLQGMTTDEGSYQGSKDYNSNYYNYQHFDGYESQTKKSDQRYSSAPPTHTASVLKYRNTEHRFPDAPSTPNYYDRAKNPEYVVGQAAPGSANRQFVVGSVPKDYPPYEEKLPTLPTPGKLSNTYEPTESGQVQFNHDVEQSFTYPGGSVQSYGQVQTARPEEAYEEVEITPTAVAVEHGPRSLDLKSSLPDLESSLGRSRRKRDSVIQIIPSKRELEEEEKEENLSNEILNIIDSALPGEELEKAKRNNKDNEVEDFDVDRRKEKEEEKTRSKESTMKSVVTESNTVSIADTSSQEPVSSATKVTESSTSTSTTSEVNFTTENSKSTEQSTEWIDPTKKPEQEGFNLFTFVKKLAEIKLRLGLTLLKHASEGFARYLGHVQKRINGEE